VTIASEIGDISRFPSARKLIGYSGLTPRVYQSGQKARTGKLSKSGSTMLRWAAIEAAQQAWRPNNPWNQLYLDVKQRCGGKGNPAKAAVARKVLIATWHVLALQQPFNPSRPAARALLSRPAPVAFWPIDGPQGIEKPGQLPPTRCAKGKRRKRTEPLPNPTLRGRYAHPRLALDIRLRLQRERNVLDHLPEAERLWVRRKLRAAWANPDAAEAEAALTALAGQLGKLNPDAAASLREGLTDTHRHPPRRHRLAPEDGDEHQPDGIDDRDRPRSRPQREALAPR
jgi:Transposase IS116/IS110/IS902 family